MFYYLYRPLLSYNIILIAAAVIPAVFLMFRVYKADHMEKESPQILWRLVLGGVFAALIALVLERVLSLLLGLAVSSGSRLYNVILYFIIVAFSEEGAKYFMLWRRSWNSPEFNCQYDGVVYAVFVSLGFAVWENISYVLMAGLSTGLSTAVIRAVTAIPGHACFGVFMGVFYSFARKYSNHGEDGMSILMRVLCIVIPALLHGTYDYIATTQTVRKALFFVVFIVVLFVVSFILVGKMSKNDKYIS